MTTSTNATPASSPDGAAAVVVAISPSSLDAAAESYETPTTNSNSNSNSSAAAPKTIYDLVMSSSSATSSSRFYTPAAALHRPIPATAATTSSLSNDNNNNNYNSNLTLADITRRSLPYCVAWTPTGPPNQQVPPDFTWLSNSCGGKAAIGVFGGGVMGLLMGVFLGAMSDATPPVQFVAGKEVPQAPLREQMKVTLRATAQKSLYWCKNFAFITGVFGGSECLVEKYRGKHDVWNAVASGFMTGAALQAKSGVQAAAIGCGGFAAFSLVIDSVMGTH